MGESPDTNQRMGGKEKDGGQKTHRKDSDISSAHAGGRAHAPVVKNQTVHSSPDLFHLAPI